jgi:hypothetical protein
MLKFGWKWIDLMIESCDQEMICRHIGKKITHVTRQNKYLLIFEDYLIGGNICAM